MARLYVVTEEEMQSLIDSLELTALRKRDEHAPQAVVHKQEISDLHRTFHGVVVRWSQAMGFKGGRF